MEASHGFAHRVEPLTLCSYQVDVDDIVDLRTVKRRKSAGVDLADLACAWEEDRSNGIEPASWTLARRLVAAGAAGILVPSFARLARQDICNVVLWKWGPDLPHQVSVYDPSGRLPKNQLSWKTAKT
jgi:RES domain-containing protein